VDIDSELQIATSATMNDQSTNIIKVMHDSKSSVTLKYDVHKLKFQHEA